MPLISIVSPVYKAEKIIPELVARIVTSLEKFTTDFEIIFVEDCGGDNSWKVIQKTAETEKRLIGLKLSKNCGQHAAITAGLDRASGDWVVVMDCDLQDQPEEIEKLYKHAIENNKEIVLAKRKIRLDNFFKRLSSKIFYKTLGYLTDTKQDPEVANFGIYKLNVIKAVLSMGDYIRFFPAMVKWVGFNISFLEVTHATRFEGDSSYNFKSLLKLGVNTVLSFSNKPLRLMIKLGVFISIISFLFAVYFLISYAMGIIKVSGFTSIMVSIWFIAGIIIVTLGMLGVYLGKIFDQVKNRPIYYISEKTDTL